MKTGETVGFAVVDDHGYIVNGAILSRKDARAWKNELNDDKEYEAHSPHRIARVVLDK